MCQMFTLKAYFLCKYSEDFYEISSGSRFLMSYTICFVFLEGSCTADKKNGTDCTIQGLKPYFTYTCVINAMSKGKTYKITELEKQTNSTSKCFFLFFLYLFQYVCTNNKKCMYLLLLS